MTQADFAYSPAAELRSDAVPLAVSIFADRARVRERLSEDARAAGLEVRGCDGLAALLEDEPRPLGDVILCDLPRIEAGALAALARLDARAAQSGAQLVVSTSVAGLEDVFACCDRSDPQILVDPSRAERAVALGRALGQLRLQGHRMCEAAADDRLVLLHLTEQVAHIARRLEGLVPLPGISGDQAAWRFESPSSGYAGPDGADESLVRMPRPPLPDPRLVRRIIRQRQLRARFFDGELFADPAWDMLLDLTAARAEHTRVSVTSLCIASGVPPTTALRWIGQMRDAGLLQRFEDERDRRRVFIALTDKAADAMASFFAQLGRTAAQLV